MKLYVGHIEFAPPESVFTPQDIHPRDFGKWAANATGEWKTNNPYFASSVCADNIVVIDSGGRVALISEWPRFGGWKDEMDPGEIWSMAGEEWIRSLPRFQNDNSK